jgi:hypothetical protein
MAARRFHGEAEAAGSPAGAGVVEPPAGLAAEAAALVAARLVWGQTGEDGWRAFRLHLRVADGWHVNTADAPSPLVPTALAASGAELRALSLPPPSRALAGLAGEPLPVWEGEVEVAGELRAAGEGPAALRLTTQPCDESRCLPAVTLELGLDG